jgi:hypothetical protein
MIRSMSYSRYFKIATPMATGSAAAPMMATSPTACHQPRALLSCVEASRPAKQATAPLASHLNCSRRSQAAATASSSASNPAAASATVAPHDASSARTADYVRTVPGTSRPGAEHLRPASAAAPLTAMRNS